MSSSLYAQVTLPIYQSLSTSLTKLFSVYAKGLDWHDAQVLSLSVSSNSFKFTTYGKSWKGTSNSLDFSDNLYIKLETEIYTSGNGVDFLPFLSCIPSASLRFLKVFDLAFPQDNCFTCSSRPQFHEFLASLLSVETLITSNHTIFRLLKYSSPSIACFPLLRTLQMRQLENYEPSTIHKGIMDFLHWRTKGGQAIEVLDLTLSCGAYDHDFGFLEEMTGLRVCWGSRDGPVHEYVCGTGSPEMLDLREFAILANEKLFSLCLQFEAQLDDNMLWDDKPHENEG